MQELDDTKRKADKLTCEASAHSSPLALVTCEASAHSSTLALVPWP